eukprot:Gregarina_sp_Poly_1__3193@NODE_1908_length_3103_cov_113_894928_g1232_i0_p6_GENE_NODE_1908_length_3103_cov_113_894928_g1232_i0NODE_1908_length_3103_cov_113_894928_g1232_i0_p6_ORF_typecomplete_len157_score33_15_NODE_1908_length_3103_cov_113_894928_g1232_i08731343
MMTLMQISEEGGLGLIGSKKGVNESNSLKDDKQAMEEKVDPGNGKEIGFIGKSPTKMNGEGNSPEKFPEKQRGLEATLLGKLHLKKETDAPHAGVLDDTSSTSKLIIRTPLGEATLSRPVKRTVSLEGKDPQKAFEKFAVGSMQGEEPHKLKSMSY